MRVIKVLKHLEAMKLYPPRFSVEVIRTPRVQADLSTKIIVNGVEPETFVPIDAYQQGKLESIVVTVGIWNIKIIGAEQPISQASKNNPEPVGMLVLCM